MARYALVVGITQNHTPLQTLEKSVADASAIAAMLRDFGDFEVELVVKPEQTTCKALAAKLREFLEVRALRHEALIYYTGHGFPVLDAFGETEAFLAPSDCVVELGADGRVARQQNGLSLLAVSKLSARAELSNLVMLLDCCHSGYLLEESLLKQTFTTFIQKDYWLMTACRSFQSAYAKQSDRYSIFTGAVLAGLNRDRANDRGEVTVGALFNSVAEAMRGELQEVMQLSLGRQTWVVRYRLVESVPPQIEIDLEAPKISKKSMSDESISIDPPAPTDRSTGKRQRLEKRQTTLQSEWQIRTEKLTQISASFAIQTDPSIKFQLENQIADEEAKILELEQKLDKIEQSIAAC
ncbi:caspase family protein [Chamaesiphon sp. OTE_75_metabat_556]|uniref:caspase family protein n=1 Tax=Chamaesiphon sp. OTE_75_metabat_556 TaxID=2964692 RepID=UPI00286BC7D6|nr:caspase family protein [Chamaesiphon sp. OTE_75_metabat_556]